MRYYLIVNGRQDKLPLQDEIRRQIDECQPILEQRGDTTDIYITKASGDATQHIKSYCEVHPDESVCFIACGGDGTINEVASGIVGQPNKHLSIISLYGHGNDFIKYYPARKFEHLSEILNGESTPIDILRVNDRYSINVCNFGFDAVVADHANRLAAKGKQNVYWRGIVLALFSGRIHHATIVADGEHIADCLQSCSLANCRYIGGEFYCAPHALNNDGLIDLTLVVRTNFINFIRSLLAYKDGKHFEKKTLSKNFIYRQVKKVEIDAAKEFTVCLDGELLSEKHFSIEILPSAISLIL